MTKGLKLAEPPRRRAEVVEAVPAPKAKPRMAGQGGHKAAAAAPAPASEKFDQLAGSAKVQFNKRVTREVADGYEILAIRTRRRVPDLLAEALELLEARYGRG